MGKEVGHEFDLVPEVGVVRHQPVEQAFEVGVHAVTGHAGDHADIYGDRAHVRQKAGPRGVMVARNAAPDATNAKLWKALEAGTLLEGQPAARAAVRHQGVAGRKRRDHRRHLLDRVDPLKARRIEGGEVLHLAQGVDAHHDRRRVAQR
jgi:hypothetical protein